MYNPGQKLICIKKGTWYNLATRVPTTGPKYGEEVVVTGHGKVSETGEGLYKLQNYEKFYRAKWFRPPVRISQAVKDSFPEVIEEKVETPNLEPA